MTGIKWRELFAPTRELRQLRQENDALRAQVRALNETYSAHGRQLERVKSELREAIRDIEALG